MRRYKLKEPLFYLFAIPIFLLASVLYRVVVEGLSLIALLQDIFYNYQFDPVTVVFCTLLSLAMFSGSFVIQNYFPEVNSIDHWLQRVVYVIAFCISFFILAAVIMPITGVLLW